MSFQVIILAKLLRHCRNGLLRVSDLIYKRKICFENNIQDAQENDLVEHMQTFSCSSMKQSKYAGKVNDCTIFAKVNPQFR